MHRKTIGRGDRRNVLESQHGDGPLGATSAMLGAPAREAIVSGEVIYQHEHRADALGEEQARGVDRYDRRPQPEERRSAAVSTTSAAMR